jgi:hypothetical protein
MMIRRLALITGFVILNAFGFATGARAGEGGVAGSAAFTIAPPATGATAGTVTGVAVSAAVGKESAAAQAFNYGISTTGGTLQNSAFAIGTAGTLTTTLVGATAGTSFVTAQDSTLATPQSNTFATTDGGYSIQLGTASSNPVMKAP